MVFLLIYLILGSSSVNISWKFGLVHIEKSLTMRYAAEFVVVGPSLNDRTKDSPIF